MSKERNLKNMFLRHSDFVKIWRNKSMRLAMLGVLVLPLVYSFIYLWAFFDPYENVKYLPVAVVNEDVGVHTSEHDLEAGQKLVDKLQDNSKVKWTFVRREQMEKGFEDGSYALAVIIPKDFSEKVLTVDSPDPLQNMIEYRSDPSQNYLTGRLGNSVIQGVKANLRTQLTKGFLEEIFTAVGESTDKLQEAADGAQQIKDGAEEIKEGTDTLVSKTGELQNGAGKLAEASQQLADGLQSAEKALQDKADAKQETDNIDLSWTSIENLQKAVHKINDRVQKEAEAEGSSAEEYVNAAEEYASAVEERLKESEQLQQEANDQLEKVLEENPALAEQENVGRLQETLLALEKQSEQNIERHEWTNSFSQGEAQAISLEKLAADSQAFTDAFDQDIQNLETYYEKAKKAVDGSQELATGNAELADAITQLQEGQKKLASGIIALIDGSDELASKLSDGVDQAKESLIAEAEKEDVISDPVDVKENELHEVPNYATGFAPYFLSLSLWVGAMILFTIFDIFQFTEKIANRPVRLALVSVIGMLQAVITSVILTKVLGIEAELPMWLYLFTILIGITFIALNQMLVTYFGNVGRFLSIVILMFQLTSSGGTYPIELSPSLIQAIHPYLPMTYTVHGLRAILSSGDVTAVYQDALILLIYFCGAVLLTQLGGRYLIPALKKKKRGNMETVTPTSTS